MMDVVIVNGVRFVPESAGSDVVRAAWWERFRLRAEGGKLRAEGGKFYAEGGKLYAEGGKLYAEGDKLYAEGDKLRAEGDKLRAEGSLVFLNAVIEAYGNITLSWGNDGSVALGNGVRFGPVE